MSGAGRKVEFLIAGVQKAGTSALFDYLRDVPALQLPSIKEAHFFDDESIDWSQPNTNPYHGLFVDDGRAWGEATPIYCYWPNSLARVRAYNPAIRIILIFRDPIERAWSHWKMEYSKRKEEKPFAWCIRDGRARVADGDPTAPGHHRVFSYVERGFYGAQLSRARALFRPEQFLLLLQEDLDREPDRIVAEICTFLGVAPPDAPLAPRRVREAAKIDYPSALTDQDRMLLAALYRDDMNLFGSLTGWDLSHWLRV